MASVAPIGIDVLSAALDAALDAVVVMDETGRIVALNAAGERMFGYTREHAIGRELATLIVPPALRERHRRGLAQYLATGRPTILGRHARFEALRRGGETFDVELAVAEIPGGPRRMFAGFLRDLSEQSREERLRGSHSRVMQRMAAGAALEETLDAIVQLIEESDADILASIVLLEPGGRRIRHGAAGRLPASYWRELDGREIGPRAGSCGTALYRREPVIVEDIARDPLWDDYRDLAGRHGLRACWSTPILDPQGSALGSFALYLRSPGLPQARHARLIDLATRTATIALLRARDDAERAALLAQLGEREALFRSVFENAAIGVSVTDLQGRFVRCNPALVRLLGYAEAELVGRKFAEITHPEDIEPNLSLYQELVAGRREHFELEKRYLRKDGSVIWVALAVSRVRATSGAPDFTVGMMQDITERRRAQDELRDTERRLRGILDAMTVGFMAVDRDWRVRFANPEAGRILARDAAALVGGTLQQAFPELAGGPLEADLRRVLDERITLTGERYFEPWRRWFDIRVEPAPEGLAAFFRDTTVQRRAERDLAATQERYRRLIEVSPDAIYVLQDGRFAFANEAALRLFGARDTAELVGRAALELTHPDYRAMAAARLRALEDEGAHSNPRAEQVFLRLDGTPLDVEVVSVRLTLEGRPAVQVVARDIGERRRTVDELQRFRAAMDASGDAIVLVDRASMRYVDANQTLCDMTGHSREAILGMSPMQLFGVAQDVLERDYDAIIADPSSTAAHVEGAYRHRNGSLVPVESRRRALRSKEGWIIVATARDVSERKLAEQRIVYLATHDSLTGLPNRSLLQDRITQAIAHARRSRGQLAVLCLDLDRFKVINDGHGHPVGDAVLRGVAGRVSALLRETDTVARYGGDEFVILLGELRRAADAHVVANKIVEALAQPIVASGVEIHASASVGVAVFPHDGATADVLIAHADAAMYQAKDLGRNNYQFYTSQMGAESRRRVEIEVRLRGALAAGTLRLAYQPKVNLATGEITGCEALLRWSDPELGDVSPGQFIPIAEESGLILPIGDWVLRSACAQCQAWTAAGLPAVTVAVNVSARQFVRHDVVSWVTRTLADTGLAPGQLELELTESMIAQDVDSAIATVRALKAAGVRLAIDDFGTGYSNLSHLRRFGADVLKIDHSFVRGLESNVDDATIVLAVISLAHNLRMTAVAEGVETDAQRQFLRLNRCDEIQGYYVGRPMPPAEFETLLRGARGGRR